MTAEERFNANPELVARVKANREDPARLVKRHDLKLAARSDVLDAINEARQHPEKLVRGRRRPVVDADLEEGTGQ